MRAARRASGWYRADRPSSDFDRHFLERRRQAALLDRIIAIYRRDGVLPDVEAFAETVLHPQRMLDPAARDDLAIDQQGENAARTALRAVGGEIGRQLVRAGAKRPARADRILAIAKAVIVKDGRRRAALTKSG